MAHERLLRDRGLQDGSLRKRIVLCVGALAPVLAILMGCSSTGRYVDSLSYSPDGRYLAVAKMNSPGEARDGSVTLWEASMGKEVRTLYRGPEWCHSIAFSPDGTRLVGGFGEGSSRVWDIEREAPILTLSFRKEGSSYPSGGGHVAWSPDGSMIACTGEYWSRHMSRSGPIVLWDAHSGEVLRTLSDHKSYQGPIAFSPDGTYLASGGAGHSLWVWEVSNGRPVKTLYGHFAPIAALAFSRDGKTLVSSDVKREIKVWDLASGKELLTLSGHSQNVTCLTFSPDGGTVVSGSRDGTIRFWDSHTGKELRMLHARDVVFTLSWSPDGRKLASAGFGHVVQIWDVEKGTGQEFSVEN